MAAVPLKNPFPLEVIEEWASYGKQVQAKPATPAELELLRERSAKMTAMKKRLCVELNDKKRWSERAIARELDKLVMEQQQKDITPRPAYQLHNNHPDNIVDHRSKGGPLLNLLWCKDNENDTNSKEPPLEGQTLYLGGEVGSDGNIYCIPGHASKVLLIDTKKNEVSQIGPTLRTNCKGESTANGRLYKWLRGIVVGDIIYGLPCHGDSLLRIHVPTQEITTLQIPYEDCYDDAEEAKKQREMIWKYHGGTICPLDNCIYAIPQSANRVLKLDPATETVSFHGPKFEGRCKWYGGIVGKSDGAIYGIPQNASGVLRITPNDATIHGDFGVGNHKWHGGAAASNGVIVSVPANSDTSLCITPGDPANPEPTLTLVGNSDIIQSGRHRDDGKYKYLGAMCGTNGKVYLFPNASEHVLQIDTIQMKAKNVGPNLLDSGMEMVMQNKWQNGLTCDHDKCVYGMPLSGDTLLRIDCSGSKQNHNGDDDDDDPVVTVWKLPTPKRECRDKYEGGVITNCGVMYTVPNNHKAVLRIEPAILSS